MDASGTQTYQAKKAVESCEMHSDDSRRVDDKEVDIFKYRMQEMT